jgi:Protein of unknown function (DUF3303)
MKFLSTFSVRPGCWQEAASRFLAGKGQPTQGVKLLGRWHNTDLSGGFSLIETDDPAAAYAYSVQWSDVLEMHTHPVIEDADAGPALAQRYGSPK